MKAFWWFENDKIAGMARLGFNCTHWFDLPFNEAALMGWIGQFSSGEQDYKKLRTHSETYVRKIAPYYGLDEEQTNDTVDKLNDPRELALIFEKIRKRTHLLKNFECDSSTIRFEFCGDRLNKEIKFLKENNIQTVISLTEDHHNKSKLEKEFDVHHFSIKDLGAPLKSQAMDMATVFDRSQSKNGAVVVHCLAGIGRTSTMILAAKLLLGEEISSLKSLIKKNNPSYILTGEQSDFIHSLVL